MIEINNLEKSYGSKKAIDIPQYSIADGDMLGLVGNNGAGKTTARERPPCSASSWTW